jgi:hypothetical protein
MSSYKSQERTTTLGAIISDAFEALQSLRDEAQEVCDNMPENLQGGDSYSTFESNTSSLSECDSIPDVPEVIKELPVKYTEEVKSSHVSRAVRCSNCVNMLDAAVGVIEDWQEKNKEPENEEVEQLRDEVQQMKDNAEGTEWPGRNG